MSEVSVLSHEYKTASELSRVVNNIAIQLKKEHSGYGGETFAPDDLSDERQHVADILLALAWSLDPAGANGTDLAAATQVSGALVARLRVEKGGELAYYAQDLRSTASRLTDEPGKLTDKDLTLLDDLAATASAETSRVYRRLMRK